MYLIDLKELLQCAAVVGDGDDDERWTARSSGFIKEVGTSRIFG